MAELPIDWNVRRRQAARKLSLALDRLRNLEASFGPHPAHMEPWPLSKLRWIKEDVAEAYDLMTEQVEPAELLDEMADL